MKKDKWLKIRISTEDDNKLRKMAADRKMTITAFVMERIFIDHVKIPILGKVK